ncbi:F-box/kelch-repeat protein At3g23880-like isoform X1 [Fagus crenata]
MALVAKLYVSLPQDLVDDILSRLPVKSFIRFKCVSKAWHALITSRQFATSHFQKSSQNPKVLVMIGHEDYHVRVVQSKALAISQNHVEFEPVVVGFPLRGTTNIGRVYTTLASCNGLVCVEFFDQYTDTYEYLVWNPSTRSNRNIPRSTTFDSSFDGSYSFGFGYDYSTHDYKLLRSYYNDKVPMKQHSTFFNGAIYWAVEPKSTPELMKPSIIYFDLAEEIFHEVSFPESLSYFTRGGYFKVLSELGILGEHLCLSVCTDQDFNNFSIQLWVMKKSWTWTRLATIPYQNSCLRPIFLSNNNSEVLMLDTGIKGDGVELIMYNLKENTNTTIFKPKPGIESMCNWNTYIGTRRIYNDPDPVIEVAMYVESLYSFDYNE